MSVEVQPIFSCSLFRMIIIQSNRGITYFQEVGKMYVVTIERCMRTENFPLRKIGWVITVDALYTGYVVTRLNCKWKK